MENICRFVPYHKDYHSLHTINFVLEITDQFENSLISQAVYKMYLVKSGKGILHTAGNKTPVSKGDIFFTFPSMPFGIEHIDNFSYMYISYLGARGNMIMEKVGVNERNFVFHGFSELLPFWENGLLAKTELSDLVAESILLYSFSKIGEKTILSDEKKQSGEISLLIKKYVDDNFSLPTLSLESISQEFSYNKKYISTVFKKSVGIGLSEYLNTIRIQHSCTLIEQGFTSISDISTLSGFSDSGYFSKVFKQKMGVSPASYIKQKRK